MDLLYVVILTHLLAVVMHMQLACLNDITNRVRFISLWDNPHANIDFTYCNHFLNQFSVIDHFIVSSNIYDIPL